MVDVATLDRDCIDVWRIDLVDSRWDRSLHRLDSAEQARAQRYRRATDGWHFARTRAALRLLLAGYTGREPGDIRFGFGAHGKPMAEGHPVHFNVSHSGDIALIGFADQPLGIDIESRRELHADLEAMASHVLHPSELLRFRELPVGQRPAHFYRAWTRKEAYCKLIGNGLLLDMPGVHFSDALADGVRQVIDARSAPGLPCFVRDLVETEDYSASVCVASRRATVRRLRARPPC